MTMQKIFQRIFSASPLAHNLMFHSTLAKTGFLNITTWKKLISKEKFLLTCLIKRRLLAGDVPVSGS